MSKKNYILGLNHGEINSSAALVHGGKVLSGCPEERFNREKRTKSFPVKSIEFCMNHAGIEFSDINAIAQAWNPGAAWDNYNPLISGQRTRREDYFYSIPDNLLNLSDRNVGDWVRMDYSKEFGLPPTYFVQHHRAHAANAFYLSPFDQAAVLTCDWRGETECTTWNFCCGNDVQTLQTQKIPNSLGMFYATFTNFLGYKVDSDEWKVMALSAFDVDSKPFEKKIRETVKLNEDGTFELDQSYYNGAILDQPGLYTKKFSALFENRIPEISTEPDEWHFCVARAMQNVAEDIAVHLLQHLYSITKCKTLGLGGGFFMNSVFNGKAIELTPFEEVYISYAPSDVGNSLGAALYTSHMLCGYPREITINPSQIGPSFSDDEIESALNRRKITYEKIPNMPSKIAGLLLEGHIVAVFNGRMEFGERALGNRSILGDPRDKTMKDKINKSIKYRESFRPFAPAVLADRVCEIFDVEKNFKCTFMEKVVPVRTQHRDNLPAITHVDGSGRVQTVEKENDPFFYKIIEEFEKHSGYPLVLNTSFNINGEPIALSPDDALTTFFNSGLEHIAIGSFLVKKHFI